MTTLLLAEQEEAAVRSLASNLEALRPEWTILTATDSHTVLQQSASDKIDVLLCASELHDTDCFSLLETLKQDHPRTIRFVRSSNPHHEVILESLRCCHRFVNRCVSEPELVRAIDDSVALNIILGDERTLTSMERLTHLPTLPDIYQRMIETLACPQGCIHAIADIIQSDTALAVTVLKTANSAYHARNHTISSVAQAASLLGVHLIKNITLIATVFSQFEGSSLTLERLQALNDLANKSGSLANQFARLAGLRRCDVDHAQLAGLLGGIGEMVGALIHDADPQAAPVFNNPVQQSILAGCLLRTWLMPDCVIEAVALQHSLPDLSHEILGTHNVLHGIRYLQQHWPERYDREIAAQCTEYLTALTHSERIAEDWVECFNDLQILTGHRDVAA